MLSQKHWLDSIDDVAGMTLSKLVFEPFGDLMLAGWLDRPINPSVQTEKGWIEFPSKNVADFTGKYFDNS